MTSLLSREASAATNPAAALITVRCGLQGAVPPDLGCKQLEIDSNKGGIISGTVEILSGGVVVASETNPLVYVHLDRFDKGLATIVATGNGNPALFAAWYTDPATSVLSAPDLTVKVWIVKNRVSTLVVNQAYGPSGSTLWSRNSEDAQAEIARAKAAEAALQAAIGAGDGSLKAGLAAETARAKAAEGVLDARINAEELARQTGDFDLQMALNVEIANRTNADGALQNSINLSDANLRALIAAETTRASAAEGAETSRAKAAEGALQTSLNDEIAARKQGDIDALANAKLYSDGRLANETAARLAAEALLGTNLNNEIARAKAAEGVLQTALSAEIVRAQSAEMVIRTDLSAEIARALAAEAALSAGQAAGLAALQAALNTEIADRKQGDLDTLAAAKLYTDGQVAAEAARATGAEALLTTNLNNEVTRAQAAEAALQLALNNEITRATDAEALLTTNLNNEVTRALAAEALLTTGLNNEVTRATAAEAQLAADLAAETARAKSAENQKANVTLDNLSAVAINASLLPGAAGAIDLGAGAKGWRTLFVGNNASNTAGVNFQPAGGGNQTLVAAAAATANRTITFPDADGVVAVSAGGNIALDASGRITFTGILPIASGGTSNTSFDAGKFVAYDGSKLASTAFDGASFAAANASITVAAGVGLSGGGNVPLGGTVTLSNAGVTGVTGGGGITVSAATGAVVLGSAAGGDLSGALSSALVTGLRGRTVAADAPSAGQVLTWDGAQWAPSTPVAGGVGGTGTANRLARWSGANAIANSAITDDGVAVTVASSLSATALGIGGDVRTSWNNPDASSVNPMPRTCPVGQVAISRGPYQWQCSAICQLGAADCNGIANDGCEAVVSSDISNCGACGTVCSNNHIAAPTCSQGICNGACDVGFADCNGNKQLDGCEVGLTNDTANCGACGIGCSSNNIASPSCGGGLCNGACNVGFADCNANKQGDGCETAVATSPNNCGGCGFVCSSLNIASRTCAGGVCNGACNAGFADCNANKLADGCETNLGSDVLNCGGCGTVCSTNNVNRACGGGSCNAGSCNAGFADCNANKQLDGCEINITNNVNNCGACGSACALVANGTQTCAAGACKIGACNANFFDVNGAYGDGCECNAPGLNACGSASSLGQIIWAGQIIQSGVLPGGLGERWFTVNFANSGASYHPHIYISSGANYVLDVFNGCGGGALSCGEGGTSVGMTNWEVGQTAGDPGTGSGTFTWATPSPGTQLFVRIRATANTGCSGFTVVFVNG